MSKNAHHQSKFRAKLPSKKETTLEDKFLEPIKREESLEEEKNEVDVRDIMRRARIYQKDQIAHREKGYPVLRQTAKSVFEWYGFVFTHPQERE